VLTHVPPWGDPQVALAEARTTYDGEIELATAGAVFEV
jgi:ribonuclease BN (tRNA processing enzyme)